MRWSGTFALRGRAKRPPGTREKIQVCVKEEKFIKYITFVPLKRERERVSYIKAYEIEDDLKISLYLKNFSATYEFVSECVHYIFFSISVLHFLYIYINAHKNIHLKFI